jgi:hypothetical protein
MRSAFAVSMAVGLLVLAATSAHAFADKTVEGKVVSATAGSNGADGKLVITDNDGQNEKSHNVGAAAKITLDGKAAKLGDLKKGDSVKVTMDDAGKISAVAATRAKPA